MSFHCSIFKDSCFFASSNPLSDGFINDSSQLGYTQDELDRVNADIEVEEIEGVGGEEHVLHRQFDHQNDMNQRFNTPVFNRRMRNPASQSQSAESSQKGLGNMNFIRSVLEHAAAGGDADQLEKEYDRLARNNQNNCKNFYCGFFKTVRCM